MTYSHADNRQDARTKLINAFRDQTMLDESLITPMVDAVERYALTMTDDKAYKYSDGETQYVAFTDFTRENKPKSGDVSFDAEAWWDKAPKSNNPPAEGGQTNIQKMWPFITAAMRQFRYEPPEFEAYSNQQANLKTARRDAEMYRIGMRTVVYTVNEGLNEQAEENDWCDTYEDKLEEANERIANAVRARLVNVNGASEAQIGQVIRSIPDFEGRTYTWSGYAYRTVVLTVKVEVSDIEARDEDSARSVAEDLIDEVDVDEDFIAQAIRYGHVTIEDAQACESHEVEVEKD